MAYRNGTYIAFHADGTPNPTASDMKYYNTMRMWKVREDNDFRFVNSHEKTGNVRDTSSRETLRRSLVERLNDSKNFVLIIGQTTRFDTDWVPFEIEYAIDKCKLPIIAVYPSYNWILSPAALYSLWPKALQDRINNSTAHVIHIPFRQKPLTDAVSQFHVSNLVGSPLGFYTKETYQGWGIIPSE